MRGLRSGIACLAALLAGSVAAAAPTTSNLAREKGWADQVVDMVVVGEPVWLQNRGHKFLSLYAPPAGDGNTAIVLLHGRGVHPAWGFIDRLRSDLADAGFHTLSLQLPILAADAPFGSYGPTLPEAFERVNAGIQYLRKHKGVQRVVLLGHSSGASTALGHTARHPQAGVAGVVAIGAATYPNTTDLLQPVQQLRQIRAAVLDISGGNDLQEVKSHNKERRDAARAGRVDFTAVQIAGADHFYTDHYEQLRAQIVAWLGRWKAK